MVFNQKNLYGGRQKNYIHVKILILVCPNRHFQLNPILILEFDIGVRIIILRDILKDKV